MLLSLADTAAGCGSSNGHAQRDEQKKFNILMVKINPATELEVPHQQEVV